MWPTNIVALNVQESKLQSNEVPQVWTHNDQDE